MKYFKFVFIAALIALLIACGDITTSPELGDVPYNLQISKIATNNIRLTWLSSVYGDTLVFYIARKVGNGGWNEYYGEVNGNAFEFFDYINTSDNQVYAYKVRYHNLEDGTFSNFSQAVAYFSEFTVPSDLLIEQESQTQLTLTWTDNCIGEEGIRIDKKTGGGNWQKKYLELPPNTVSIIDNVALFDTLYYRVYVFFGKSESGTAQDSIFQTLSAPADLTANLLDINKIRLNWTDNSQSEEGFYIDRKVGGQNWVNAYGSVSSNVTTFMDNVNYTCASLRYRVRAYSGQFTSDSSEETAINLNLGIIGEIYTPGDALQVAFSEWTAYVADNYSGLAVIDCFTPNQPQLLASYNLADRTLSSHIAQNFTYVATHSGLNSPGMIQKLDITDKANPVLVGFANVQGIPKDIFVDGDFAYIAEGSNGLTIVYIAGSNLYFVSNFPLNDARAVFVKDGIAFVADGINGLKIFNILIPSLPTLISQISTNGICNDVHAVGSYAFLADGETGLRILNISNILNPVTIKTINTGGFVYAVQAEADHVYFVDKEKGFFAIDYSVPSAAVVVGQIELDSEPVSAFLSGSYVYITDNEGLKIIQVKP